MSPCLPYLPCHHVQHVTIPPCCHTCECIPCGAVGCVLPAVDNHGPSIRKFLLLAVDLCKKTKNFVWFLRNTVIWPAQVLKVPDLSRHLILKKNKTNKHVVCCVMLCCMMCGVLCGVMWCCIVWWVVLCCWFVFCQIKSLSVPRWSLRPPSLWLCSLLLLSQTVTSQHNFQTPWSRHCQANTEHTYSVTETEQQDISTVSQITPYSIHGL